MLGSMSGSMFHDESYEGIPNRRLPWGCTMWLVLLLLMMVLSNMIAVSMATDELFQELLQSNLDQARAAQTHVANFLQMEDFSGKATGADDCKELLNVTVDQLTNVASESRKTTVQNQDSVQTWLTASLANQYTCAESIQSDSGPDYDLLRSMTKNLSKSICESVTAYIFTRPQHTQVGRKMLSRKFPVWLTVADRKLLEAPVEDMTADAVVAKDGSGTHTTIGGALDMVKFNMVNTNHRRTVIHIKAGTYNEIVRIPIHIKNVLLVGDGKGKTIIAGHKNRFDGTSTFASATVGVQGTGFIARDISFVNYAGPTKHQAVALRVGADKSVVYRCSIIGYQDSLYAHSNRQFYRDCDIYGTVDFIFGHSAVVLQNCNIIARQTNDKNYVTAQKRNCLGDNSVISIQNCTITTEGSSSTTYLGRPWGKYSTTVIMQSYLDSSIHPAGWYPWDGDFALDTLYYAEYQNKGPGASMSRRVNWRGYRGELTPTEAQTFTVASLIDGDEWLHSTGVPFESGLIQ